MEVVTIETVELLEDLKEGFIGEVVGTCHVRAVDILVPEMDAEKRDSN